MSRATLCLRSRLPGCMTALRASSSSGSYLPRATFALSSQDFGRSTSSLIRTMASQAAEQSKTPPSSDHDLPPDLSNQEHTAAETDAYLFKKLAPPGDWAGEPSLVDSQKRAKEAGIPEIAVSPMQGQFLGILAKAMGASKILEIGTLWGYSTYFLTRALPSHGQIDTLEISPLHAQTASQTFLEADLYPFPKIHVGPALQTLKSLSPPGLSDGLQEGGYDLVFIDADKEKIHEYFQESLRLTRKGGVIVVDNAIRGGRIVQDQGKDGGPDVTGLRKLYDWIEQDKGKTVLASGIQTVGAKCWDGFLIATKL